MAVENNRGEKFILIVEDDRGTCELESQRLEPLGIKTRCVYGASDALAALSGETSPELLIVDYSLPGTNALKFVSGLKEAGSRIPPFIVATGRGDEAVAVASMKAGACDYIIKDSNFLDNLLPAVKKALDNVKLRKDLEAAQESTAKNLHLYTFLAQVNLAASQTKEKSSLLRQICAIAVETGGMLMAWVGLPDRDLNRVVPFCWAGAVDGYLDDIKIDIDSNTPGSAGPTGRAATQLTIQPCTDIAGDPGMAQWREKALARGYRSSAAIPLMEKGRLAAVLTVYSGQSGFFSEDELRLLNEIRADISLALDALSAEESRAAAQASLEHTAAQLAHVMDVTPVILFTLKPVPSGEIVTDWVSGNAAAITGYTLEEIVAPAWWMKNLHPDDRDRVIEEQRGLASKKSLTQDFRFRRKDGSFFWVHSQLNATGGKPGEITGSWTDITRLKESEGRMRLLSDAISSSFDEVYIFSPVNFRFIFANRAAFLNLGYSAEEMKNLTPWDLKHDFTESSFRKAVEPLLNKEQHLLLLETRHTRKNGTSYPVEVRLQLVESGPEKVFLAVINDITARLAAATELERQRRLFSDVLDNSETFIYAFDRDGRFLIANKALTAAYNKGPGMMIGKSWDGLIDPEGARQHLANNRKVLESGRSMTFEEEIHGPAGSRYYYSVKFPLRDAVGTIYAVCGISTDITEKKKTERLMEELANMQRVESLGALAGGIAHDFNNMLTGIMANLSLLSSRNSVGTDAELIHDTLEAARNAQALTTQLLSFSKGGKPVKKEICFGKALREIFSLATRGCAAAQELAVDEDLWSVEGDENQLKQAVNNILLNGIQSMPSGGTISLKAENIGDTATVPSPLQPGKYVKVTVSDSGIGIPAQYLPRIFEPYFTTKTKGHGLGLPMVWSVVKNHGGHIETESEPGKGTQFRIFLPATGRSLKVEAARVIKVAKGSGRILLLEDEEIVSRAAIRMLTELGYSCEITADGKEALKVYAAAKECGKPFDAVIMDLTIPGGMGGKEAGAELRRVSPEAVIIVSSGYSDEPVMADYHSFGFDAVLPKPYRYEDLAGALSRLLPKK